MRHDFTIPGCGAQGSVKSAGGGIRAPVYRYHFPHSGVAQPFYLYAILFIRAMFGSVNTSFSSVLLLENSDMTAP